jgi:hypothetical protein
MTEPKKKRLPSLEDKLTLLNVKPSTYHAWFIKYGRKYVQQKISLMNMLANEPRSRAAWISDAVFKNYQLSTKDGVTSVHGALVATHAVIKAREAKSKRVRIPKIRRQGKAAIAKLRKELKTDKLLSTG